MARGDTIGHRDKDGQEAWVETVDSEGKRVFVPKFAVDGMGGDTVHILPSSAASQNETELVDGVTTVSQVKAENTSGSDIYVLLYDLLAVPVVGSDTPKQRLKFKAGTIAAYDFLTRYENGLGYAIVDDDGATAVASGALFDLEIHYRQ